MTDSTLDTIADWTAPLERWPLFALEVNGTAVSRGVQGLRVGAPEPSTRSPAGWSEVAVPATWDTGAGVLALRWHCRRYDDADVAECWTEIENTTRDVVHLQRADSLSIALAGDIRRTTRWTSSWGAEFEPVTERRDGATPRGRLTVGTTAGRSSQGAHPQLELAAADGSLLLATVAWSGNWQLVLEPAAGEANSSTATLSGGLASAGLDLELAAGEHLRTPPVVLAWSGDGDRDAIADQLHRVGRAHWFPVNDLHSALPVEWNHWWPYEDAEIDEQTFLANVDAAADLGVEIATLDAGWFGPADSAGDWVAHRGDWDLVNTARFPRGLRPVADHVHERGLAFGLWCEIEALGPAAAVNRTRPDLPATRGGEPLGYVCLANPDGRSWAEQTLTRLIEQSTCDWVKLDFNLDPGLGCDRTDHGHGAGDGLFGHYTAYYAMLDSVRSRFPQLVLENCSSGGLRIDLGMARHTHTTFLSDPDWPEHSLQLYWEALSTLPPERMLRWSFSQWRGDHPEQTFDPSDPTLSASTFDCWTRIAMLSGFGISLRLPDLPGWVRDRLAAHIATYRTVVRSYVPSRVYRLTGQPLRRGRGERSPAFQFAHADGTHLLAAFRLPGTTEAVSPIRLTGLEPARTYRLRWLDDDREDSATGAQLMRDGIELPPETPGSALIHLSDERHADR